MPIKEEPSHERAIALILVGRLLKREVKEKIATSPTDYFNWQDEAESCVRSFFNRLSGNDVEASINRFESASNQPDRLREAQVLSAYFNYCAKHGLKETFDHKPVGALLRKFATVFIKRLCRHEHDDQSRSAIPTWQSPDLAFGLKKSSYRPLDGNKANRDMAIVSLLELEARQSTPTREAIKKVCRKFKVSAANVAVIQKKMSTIVRHLNHYSSEELEAHLGFWADMKKSKKK